MTFQMASYHVNFPFSTCINVVKSFYNTDRMNRKNDDKILDFIRRMTSNCHIFNTNLLYHILASICRAPGCALNRLIRRTLANVNGIVLCNACTMFSKIVSVSVSGSTTKSRLMSWSETSNDSIKRETISVLRIVISADISYSTLRVGSRKNDTSKMSIRCSINCCFFAIISELKNDQMSNRKWPILFDLTYSQCLLCLNFRFEILIPKIKRFKWI